MQFDALSKAGCVVAGAGSGGNGGNGSGGANPPDPRCADAEFASANPNICGTSSYLVLKPQTSIISKLASIAFKVFEYKGGVESEVVDNLAFKSSDTDTFLIGVSAGSGTGLKAGDVIITVTRKGLSATAKVTVLDSLAGCDNINVKTALIIDNSKSMGLTFGVGYQTRLDYAIAAASQYASKIYTVADVPKDSVKVWSFNEVPTEVTGFLTNTSDLVTAIDGIPQLLAKTNLKTMLDAVIADLTLVDAGERVIIIFSDGEQTANSDTQGILTSAAAFKAAGGIIICVGVRSAGNGFDLLERISTGGFFLNATTLSANETLQGLSFLKSSLCAGTCAIIGRNEYAGALDYSSFQHWEVVAGSVDLNGNGFLDFLPDNGLYVDMVGTAPYQSNTNGATTPFGATIRTIDTFALQSGHDYTISFRLAGNNRIAPLSGSQGIKVYIRDTAASDTDPNLFEHVVSPAWNAGFQLYTFTFTAPYAGSFRVYFQQIIAVGQFGNLLDTITFKDESTQTGLLFDNFDTENPVTIPPSSGDYCEPVAAIGPQFADANPLPDVESGSVSPQLFNSTKNVCLSCPEGQTNQSAASLVPRLSTDTWSGGSITSTPEVSVDGARGFNAFDQNDGTGWIAFDNPPVWIQANFTSARVVNSYSMQALAVQVPDVTGIPLTYPKDWQFQGSNDNSAWTTLDTETGKIWFGGEIKAFAVTNTTAYKYYRVYVTATTDPTGLGNVSICEISLYGTAPSQSVCKTAQASSYTSQQDADAKANAAATQAAQASLNCVSTYTSTRSYTATAANCPVGSVTGGDVTRTATATSFISQQDADDKATAAAKEAALADLDCSGSNNTQQIIINDAPNGGIAAATPFPSTKFVSGRTGLVTKVTVSLKKFAHTHPRDTLVVLRSPSGQTCVLMANVGGAISITNVDIGFDDSAGSSLTTGVITTGTYKPTALGVYPELPQPAPRQPFGTTLAAFNGINPNGAWSLWIADITHLDFGKIQDGWDLVITSV